MCLGVSADQADAIRVMALCQISTEVLLAQYQLLDDDRVLSKGNCYVGRCPNCPGRDFPLAPR
jgi:hypothetical protein